MSGKRTALSLQRTGFPYDMVLSEPLRLKPLSGIDALNASTALLSDAIALGCFMICWFGYSQMAKLLTQRRASLISTVKVFRERWMRRMCERDNHIADAALLSNLLRGALFFASTTVFILGGLLAVLGTGPKVAEVVSALPYVAHSEPWLMEVKATVLIIVFIYAFFKFTWSAWQYNVLSILVGAAPAPETDKEEIHQFARSAAQIASLAGESYNNGIRAYYFSIALMAWFIHSLLFLAVTLIVALVMYRREFASPMLQSLRAAVASK